MATALENARLFQETQQAFDELRRTQDQLVQSQKMEAIGRLAGGVAHDFNNLLTVIRGRSELLVQRLHPDDPLRGQISLIDETAHRAATLTQQLLAFSRRQILQPRIFDLNEVVAGMGTMLRRLIGEDVELVTTLHPAPIWIKADPGQVEQVILNLAVNGRDAMPQGGRLSLQTAVVARDARPHARLTVSDTGAGMTPDVQAHLFEPFFTTKGVGQGTGLGLATVYGIVDQSGGQITVESAPGQGARFDIYLPWLPAPELPGNGGWSADAAGRTPRAAPGAETVLLVEDEAAVRELTREILELEGYTVLEAADGPTALALVRDVPGSIDLLLTDVVMPQLSGGQLAARLLQERPDLRVLFMSGYTEDAIVHHGVRDAGAALLPKPFTPDALARKVRETLDAVRAAP
jgi:nitrogen-specific signal transduction histidine kinase/CheY-like chemotaxis protein